MALSADDQAELARRVALTRDRAAFSALYDHFAPRLNAYLRRLRLDSGAAEEITQEVMIVLWHKAGLFDASKSSLATWLFRIARNRRIDMARRDSTRTLDPDDPYFQPDASPEPGIAMDARKRDERIRAAMQGLPEEQLELVKLAFFIGLSHSEIAERCGLPLGTVKSRIRLAFARLKRALQDDPGVDTDRAD